QRRDQPRSGEEQAPAALLSVAVRAPPVAPERERRAPQHDPDEHEGERDVEPRAEQRERRWEAGEEQHDGEDEPDVVRLPYRADRVGDELALALLAGPACEQGPHAAPEVRAPEQRVGVERHENDSGENVRERHPPLPAPCSLLPAGMYHPRHSGTSGLRRICRYNSQPTRTPGAQYARLTASN